MERFSSLNGFDTWREQWNAASMFPWFIMTNGLCKLMRLLYKLSDLRSFQTANDVVRSEGVLVNLRVWTTQRQTETEREIKLWKNSSYCHYKHQQTLLAITFERLCITVILAQLKGDFSHNVKRTDFYHGKITVTHPLEWLLGFLKQKQNVKNNTFSIITVKKKKKMTCSCKNTVNRHIL